MSEKVKYQEPYSKNFFTQIRKIFVTLTWILELILPLHTLGEYVKYKERYMRWRDRERQVSFSVIPKMIPNLKLCKLLANKI